MTNGILLPPLLFLRLFSYTRPATVGAEGRIGSQTLPRATLLSTELGVEIKFSGYRCIDTGIMKRSYKLDILIVVAFSR